MRRLLSLFVCLPLLCGARSSSVSFIENVGQVTDQNHNTRKDIQFKVPGENMNIFIGNNAMHYQFAAKTEATETAPAALNMYRMDVTLVGANANAKVVKEQKNNYHETYYTPGLEGARAFSYSRVVYQNVYPNIDWVIYSEGSNLKYEFVVKQGGKPSDIKMKYAGATKLAIAADGKLIAGTPMGTVTENAPYTYALNSKKEKIASSFVLNGDVLSFNVGNYDGAMVIDPTLTWGTYFGGSLDEAARGMTTDMDGNIYITGYTNSTSNIATTGAHQTTATGLSSFVNDGFIVKKDAMGATVWATYYGGSLDDRLEGIATDGHGNVFVGGYTFSQSGIATTGAHLATKGSGDQEGLLAKFNATGARVWGTYYGAINSWESISELAYDKKGGYVYAIGSGSGAGISTTGAHQETSGGSGSYGFLVKFDTIGVRQWGTFYGGNNLTTNNFTALKDVTVNKDGYVYIVGHTNTSNKIYSTGAFDTTFANGTGSSPYDAFVAKFDGDGVRQWGTYYGGTGDEEATSIAVDSNDNVYIGGMTKSFLLSTTGAHQTAVGGVWDGFIAMFSGAGTQTWSTYYGGLLDDRITDLHVDATNTLYFAGNTSSVAGIASAAPWTLKTTLAGGTDAFVGRMHADGKRLWASYYGGTGTDAVMDISTTNTGDVIIGGETSSTTDIATTGSFKETIGGATDYFLAKMYDCYMLTPDEILGSATVCANSAQEFMIDSVAGATSYTWTLPNGWSGTSTTGTINANVGTTGGDITVVATNSCGSSEPRILSVTVNALPTPSISLNGSTLTVNSTFSAYQWYKDGNMIGGANAQTYTAAQTGNYKVEVTDMNNCVGQSTAMMAFGTNVNDISAAKGLNIYPNPNNGVFTVVYGAAGSYNLTVTNVIGMKVFETTLEGGKEQAINLGNGLAAGNYFIEIAGAGKKVHGRITIK
ncbi:MAG: T9SS type A sorting domain-containing protein [Sphingobacteriales bacterium]|nr:MAG: T9SS type A sorting domain-containing protein [Sphingobacteriales bacterium]